MGRVSCKLAANLAPGAGGGNGLRNMVVMVLARDTRLPAAFRTGYAPNMTLFTRTLWPERVARPYLRLTGALIAAPLVLAAALTLLAFLIAGSTEFTREVPAFTLTFGLAGVALLWALGRRGVLAWLVAGAGAGLLVAVGHGLFSPDGIVPMQTAVAVVLGLVLFLLIRWIAGVRLD
jgi:hypothetical protein